MTLELLGGFSALANMILRCISYSNKMEVLQESGFRASSSTMHGYQFCQGPHSCVSTKTSE